MPNIEYEIELNENGRPCIKLADDYKDKASDKFLCVEISRYILQNVYYRRSEEFDKETADKINDCITILGQISDEMSKIIWEVMKEAGDIALITNNNYYAIVNSHEDLKKLDKFFLFGERIYEKKIGLKILVSNEMKIYELIEDNGNEEWIIID